MRLTVLVIAMAFYAGAPTWERGNDLAIAYGQWDDLRNQRVVSPVRLGTVSVQEVLAWQRVKQKWHSL